MATHSSILVWKALWTEEESGGLQSMGSQRVGHDWATKTFTSSSSGHYCLVLKNSANPYSISHTLVFCSFPLILIAMRFGEYVYYFPSDAAAAAKSLQRCPTLCDPIDGSPRPWDSPGKNTGVGCHFLLQCVKAKGESEVAQSCPTLSHPMGCSPPGSSVLGIFQARVLQCKL